MLDTRRLILLRDLSEYGTVTLVAEAHGITVSAVSQQLRALEAEAGAPLMLRAGRGMRLTRAGEVLVQRTAKVVAALEEAAGAVLALDGRVQGSLVVACFQTGLGALAAPPARTLRERHPGLEVRLFDALPAQALRLLRNREADVAITYRYAPAPDDIGAGLRARRLFGERLMLLVPESLRAAAVAGGLGALSEADWIAGEDGTPCTDALVQAARAAGFNPRIAHRCHHFATMAELAAAGLGAAIVPELSARRRPPGLTVVPLDLPERRIDVVVRDGTQDRPVIAEALRVIEEELHSV
ncbi:LysR family transcriptional regulator [Streptomyces shenzhenensis]|uniref:LysR family transcriptional regulator n=1 Tax=Streptomyces shenzhenensis TaxID=943815 RepID=UPI0033F75E9B